MCCGQHSYTSSTFFIVTLNGTCSLRSAKLAISSGSEVLLTNCELTINHTIKTMKTSTVKQPTIDGSLTSVQRVDHLLGYFHECACHYNVSNVINFILFIFLTISLLGQFFLNIAMLIRDC